MQCGSSRVGDIEFRPTAVRGRRGLGGDSRSQRPLPALHSTTGDVVERRCVLWSVPHTHTHTHTSDILVLKLISVLVFILFSSQNFYFI